MPEPSRASAIAAAAVAIASTIAATLAAAAAAATAVAAIAATVPAAPVTVTAGACHRRADGGADRRAYSGTTAESRSTSKRAIAARTTFSPSTRATRPSFASE